MQELFDPAAGVGAPQDLGAFVFGELGQRGIDVAGQHADQPRHRGIRGHRPEQGRLGPHHRDTSSTVTTEGDRDRHIQ
jgi:hypothetical protein